MFVRLDGQLHPMVLNALPVLLVSSSMDLETVKLVLQVVPGVAMVVAFVLPAPLD